MGELQPFIEEPAVQARADFESYAASHYRVPFNDNLCEEDITALKITVSIRSAAVMYLNEKEVYRIGLVNLLIIASMFLCNSVFISQPAGDLSNETQIESDSVTMFTFFLGHDFVDARMNEFAASVYASSSDSPLSQLGLKIQRIVGIVRIITMLNNIQTVIFNEFQAPVDVGTIWKYSDDNVYPGDGWKRLTFNDLSWLSGRLPMAYGLVHDGVSLGVSQVQQHH